MATVQRARTRARRGRRDDLGDALASTLDRFFRGRPIWHGALWPHVADLTLEQALWRPAPDRHCVWEIVRHTTAAWQADMRRLRSVHRSLSRLFRDTSDKALLAQDSRGKFSRFWWVGVLAHDSYHTGQIAALRAMMRLKPIV